MKTKDLLLVFWDDRHLCAMQNGARAFMETMQQRAVCGYERPTSVFTREYVAAVVPMPSDETAFKNAKEIK